MDKDFGFVGGAVFAAGELVGNSLADNSSKRLGANGSPLRIGRDRFHMGLAGLVPRMTLGSAAQVLKSVKRRCPVCSC